MILAMLELEVRARGIDMRVEGFELWRSELVSLHVN